MREQNRKTNDMTVPENETLRAVPAGKNREKTLQRHSGGPVDNSLFAESANQDTLNSLWMSYMTGQKIPGKTHSAWRNTD